MRARFPGTCASCGRRYGVGAELARIAGGWSCCARPAAPAPSEGPFATRAEVLDVLEGARRVAARVGALERARAAAGRAA